MVDVVAVNHVRLESAKRPPHFELNPWIEHAKKIPESFGISGVDADHAHAIIVVLARFANVLRGGHNQNFMALGRKVPGETLHHDSGAAPIKGRIEVGQIRDFQFPTWPSTTRGIVVRFPST